MDVTDPASIDAGDREIIERWKRIDVLVNNAGMSGHTPVDHDGPEADALWDEIMDINLHGVWRMTRACLPHIPEGGRIVNISSVLGKFGVPRFGAYCAAKHGVIGLTRALAAELAPRRITVNAICPGWVDTAMSENGVRQTAEALGITPEAFRRAAIDRVPLGRFLRPEEIAPLALYLASPAAEGLTGQAINLEGAPSAISSPAPRPQTPTPSTRSDSGSITSFVTPSVRDELNARPEASKGPSPRSPSVPWPSPPSPSSRTTRLRDL